MDTYGVFSRPFRFISLWVRGKCSDQQKKHIENNNKRGREREKYFVLIKMKSAMFGSEMERNSIDMNTNTICGGKLIETTLSFIHSFNHVLLFYPNEKYFATIKVSNGKDDENNISIHDIQKLNSKSREKFLIKCETFHNFLQPW